MFQVYLYRFEYTAVLMRALVYTRQTLFNKSCAYRKDAQIWVVSWCLPVVLHWTVNMCAGVRCN